MHHIVSRILQIPITIFAVILIIFLLVHAMPGDPVRLALGFDATEEMVQKYRHEMGLDQPLTTQFFIFLNNLAHGKFGTSFLTQRDAATDILAYFPATLELTTVAMITGFFGGMLLGITCGLHRGKWIDHFSSVFTISGVSMPRFWTGILLQLFFGLWLAALPCTGRIEAWVDSPFHITGLFILDSILTMNSQALVSSLRSIILPAITLSLMPMAQVSRLVRGSIVEEGKKDYILQARANGLPRSLIVYKYMLRNAITPALTSLSISFGWTLGFAFVVEAVFAWPGIGYYGAQAAVTKDFNVVMAITFLVILIYTVINITVDIAYWYLDPRIKYRRESD